MTARLLFHRCRRLAITLAADGEAITFDAPPDVIVPVEEIRGVKDELLAVLRGDYFGAARELVMRIADPQEREALAEAFDERAGICQFDGTMARGEAERAAYIELSHHSDAQPAQWSSFRRGHCSASDDHCDHPNPSSARTTSRDASASNPRGMIRLRSRHSNNSPQPSPPQMSAPHPSTPPPAAAYRQTFVLQQQRRRRP